MPEWHVVKDGKILDRYATRDEAVAHLADHPGGTLEGPHYFGPGEWRSIATAANKAAAAKKD